MTMLTHRPIRTKPLNFSRSAMAPVGIVAAVSMNTIWKRKNARIPLMSRTPLVSKKPSPPRMPFCPNRMRNVPRCLPKSPRVDGAKLFAALAPSAGKVKFTPPNWKANPTSQYPSAPTQNTIMFIIMVCAVFLVRVKPVSTRAKPACMKNTRKPVMNVHMMFVDVTTSSMVGPLDCAEAMPFTTKTRNITMLGTMSLRRPALRIESSFIHFPAATAAG